MLLEKLMHLTPEEQVEANQHHERFFPVRLVTASGQPKVLARREDKALSAAAESFLKDNHSRGLVILKDGEIVVERYGPGFHEKSQVIAWSITKSFTSTLVGAALKDGAIASLNDPMTKYLPQLKGSCYDGVTIHHCLQMSSGALWGDAYRDVTSSIYQLYGGYERREPGWTLKLMSQLSRAAEPGTRFCYNTGETNLLGLLVAAATGKRLSSYMEEKIWHPVGMEADGQFNLDSVDGAELAGGGLSACLRDWARFGDFFLKGGVADGIEVLPKGWLARAISPGVGEDYLKAGHLAAPNILGYGYQWWTFASDGGDWPAHAGAFTGQGVFGQFLCINPKERMVAAICSTWADPWVVEHERRTYDFLADAIKRLT